MGGWSVAAATKVVIKGAVVPLDVMSIVGATRPREFCLCFVEWALMSDVDFHSEKYRWMGGVRFDFVGVQYIFKVGGSHGAVLCVRDERT